MYLARLNDAVFVLHVFEKKSRRTPDHDLRMGRVRCREAIQWHLRRRGMA
jgi:phage-related protein